jgi:hypothetical protein
MRADFAETGGSGGGLGSGFLAEASGRELCFDLTLLFSAVSLATGAAASFAGLVLAAETVTAPRSVAGAAETPVRARTDREVPDLGSADGLLGEAALLLLVVSDLLGADGLLTTVGLPSATSFGGVWLASAFATGLPEGFDLTEGLVVSAAMLAVGFRLTFDLESTLGLAVLDATGLVATILDSADLGDVDFDAPAGFVGADLDATALGGAGFAALEVVLPAGAAVDLGFAVSVAGVVFVGFAAAFAGFGNAATDLALAGAFAPTAGFLLDVAFCFGEAITGSTLLMARQMWISDELAR